METKYWTIKFNTVKFKELFYEQSLQMKYKIILELPEAVLNNITSHERCVQAIISHSTKESKKLWPVMWEKNLNSMAQKADEEYKKELEKQSC